MFTALLPGAGKRSYWMSFRSNYDDVSVWKGFTNLFASDGARASRAETSRQEAMRREFAEQVLEVARRLDGVEHAHFDEGTYSVILDCSEGNPVLALGGVFSDLRDLGPEARAESLRRTLLALLSPPPLPESRAALFAAAVPVVRPTNYMLRESFSGDPAHRLYREYQPFVVRAVAFRQGQLLAFLSAEEATRRGLVFEELYAAALENLAKDHQDEHVADYDPDVRGRIFSIESGDDCESSRLLLPGFLESFRSRVRGNPIAIVPCRDMMLIAGDAEASDVGRLIELARSEWTESGRAVSPDVYTSKAGHVVPLSLSPERLASAKLALNRQHAAAREYQLQADEFERLTLEEPRLAAAHPAFFAGVQLLSDELDSHLAAIWSVEQDVYLPRADFVHMAGRVRPDGPMRVWNATLPWDDVVRVLGELQRVPSLLPERFLVRSPDRVIFERLLDAARASTPSEELEIASESYIPAAIQRDADRMMLVLSIDPSVTSADRARDVWTDFSAGVMLGWAIDEGQCEAAFLEREAAVVEAFRKRELEPHALWRKIDASGRSRGAIAPPFERFLASCAEGQVIDLDACAAAGTRGAWPLYDACAADLKARYQAYVNGSR